MNGTGRRIRARDTRVTVAGAAVLALLGAAALTGCGEADPGERMSGPRAAKASPREEIGVRKDPVAAPSGKQLDVPWYQEEHSWWCGPASSRQALATWVDKPMTQENLADLMVTGVLEPETRAITAVTEGMNTALSGSGLGEPYVNRAFDEDTSKGEKAKQLLTDAKSTIGSRGHAMVVNVLSTENNKLHSAYPDRNVGHYVTVHGYDAAGNLTVTDPAADMSGDYTNVPSTYTVSANHLAGLLNAGDGSHYYNFLPARSMGRPGSPGKAGKHAEPGKAGKPAKPANPGKAGKLSREAGGKR